jgi:hypothetical protein
MVDYVEGLLEIRDRLRRVEEALLKKQVREARLLLGDIRHAAAETDSQIVKQFPRELGRA